MTSANGVQPTIPQNYGVPIVSPVSTGVNNLGTASIQVVAANQNRRGITFNNPGTVNVLIAPGNITPSFAAPGGAYLLYPGDEKTFPADGLLLACNCAFNAVAFSGVNNPLTIFEYL